MIVEFLKIGASCIVRFEVPNNNYIKSLNLFVIIIF